MDMWIIWLILMTCAIVVEAATLGLTTVWLAVGCLAAAVLDLLGKSVATQITVMMITTVVTFVICIIWIKPRFDNMAKQRKEATNADRLIGQEGVVIKDIDPIEGKGQVKVGGQVWSAKSPIPIVEGTKVRIKALEGVKVKVEVIDNK